MKQELKQKKRELTSQVKVPFVKTDIHNISRFLVFSKKEVNYGC